MAALVTIQFLVYATAWTATGLFVRDARGPAALWALYGVIQAAAIEVMSRLQSPRLGVALPAAMLLILAYSCANLGIDTFVHRRPRLLHAWAAILVVAEGFLLVSIAAQWPASVVALGYNLSIAVLLMTPLAATARAIRAEFGSWGLVSMFPGAVMAVIVIARVVQVAVDPAAVMVPSAPAADDARLLVAMIAAGAFNISFIGLVVGRLVHRLRGLIETDTLTGLLNRAGLEKRLAIAWQSASRFDQPLSVAFVDIDDFKVVNDTAGHGWGDTVIRRIAGVLRRCAREVDAVGRWGGDEFVIVLPQTDADGAAHAVQRLREAIHREAISGGPGSAPITLSIGVATRGAGDADLDALIERADTEMYRIKQLRTALA